MNTITHPILLEQVLPVTSNLYGYKIKGFLQGTVISNTSTGNMLHGELSYNYRTTALKYFTLKTKCKVSSDISQHGDEIYSAVCLF
jgi:hypothetical protein